MVMESDIDAIGDMDKVMSVQRQMDGKGKIWRSVHGSWEESSHTYVGPMR